MFTGLPPSPSTFTFLYNHHHHHFQNLFIFLKWNCTHWTITFYSLSLKPRSPLSYFASVNPCFWTWGKWYLCFCDQLILLGLMSSRFIHIACSFLPFKGWVFNIAFSIYTKFYFFIHWQTCGLFPLLALVNNAVNIGVQISVQIPAFNSFQCVPRSSVFPLKCVIHLNIKACVVR